MKTWMKRNERQDFCLSKRLGSGGEVKSLDECRWWPGNQKKDPLGRKEAFVWNERSEFTSDMTGMRNGLAHTGQGDVLLSRLTHLQILVVLIGGDFRNIVASRIITNTPNIHISVVLIHLCSSPVLLVYWLLNGNDPGGRGTLQVDIQAPRHSLPLLHILSWLQTNITKLKVTKLFLNPDHLTSLQQSLQTWSKLTKFFIRVYPGDVPPLRTVHTNPLLSFRSVRLFLLSLASEHSPTLDLFTLLHH